ncbi:hypothetical protein KL86DPRO_40038 [uncultured delta proteobacterium]|uniref:Uncharacterized protein n=1 Tax=uncultured delta proteobacterium TaxID=34034 RepID=A0A212K8Z3_9DELT|nr:hypothetical protein KL86DPRO_40038 [uncultured delta proteobacterium]
MNSSNILSNLQPTDLDAGQVFSGKPSGTTVRGYAAASAYTPERPGEEVRRRGHCAHRSPGTSSGA